MSDHPPHAPDPTRDTTGEAAEPTPQDAPTPEDVPTPGDVPAYDATFGLEAAPEPSWVPQRADDATATARQAPAAPSTRAARVPDGTTTPVGPASGGPRRTPRTITLPRPAARLLGGRLRAWHVVAVVIGLLVPLGLWAAIDGADDLDPLSSPARVNPRRPVVTRTVPTPQSSTVTRPTASTAPTAQAAPSGTVPTRGAMSAPPLVTVPTVPVTPVPTDAGTIRFEAQAESGTRVEVSLSDATHQRHDFAEQPAPLAFDVPVPATVTSKDYFSLRVRAAGAGGTSSADRPTVVCRVLVDGVLVTSQQGRGYATCYLSPYYDLRRR